MEEIKLILIRKRTKEEYKISEFYLLDTPNGVTQIARVYQKDKLERDFFGNTVYYNIPVDNLKEHFDIKDG